MILFFLLPLRDEGSIIIRSNGDVTVSTEEDRFGVHVERVT